MITDKLLTFAEHKKPNGINFDDHTNEIDFGAIGNEIARTLNLVCQVDLPLPKNTGNVHHFRADLLGYDGTGNLSGWRILITGNDVTIDDVRAGKRLFDFVKLPLGIEKYSKLKVIVVTLAENISESAPAQEGMVYSAYLTPSAEQEA